MKKATTKLIIADDHVLYRQGVKAALKQYPNIELLAEADNGQQLLNLLSLHRPDVILLDINMPVMDGLTALPLIKMAQPNVKVVVLSMHSDYSMTNKMMSLGANAYLTKESDVNEIIEAVEGLAERDVFFNDQINHALLEGLKTKSDEFTKTMTKDPISQQLSDKEVTILRYLCDELSAKEIAELTNTSARTIEAIRDKLREKTGAKSIAGLVMYAIKNGLLEDKDIK